MTSIGETLRQERLRQGRDLQSVSESTKIGTRMLQAMEQNDFTKLPGGVFTRSFIKQYAVVLGLDPAALDTQLSELQSEAEGPAKSEQRKDVIKERSHYSLSEYNSSRNSGSLFMSAIWVVTAVVVGGAVYFLLNRSSGAPAETQKPQVTKADAAAEKPVEAVPDKGLQDKGLPDKGQAPVAGSPIRVTVFATDKSWVSVTTDGKVQYIGDMKADEKRTFDAQEKVKLITGNAGGLNLDLNGKPVDAIGPKGQVRVVEFTSAGAHVVPRTPPKPGPLP